MLCRLHSLPVRLPLPLPVPVALPLPVRLSLLLPLPLAPLLPRPQPNLTAKVTYDHCSGIGNGVLSQEVPPLPYPYPYPYPLTLPLPLTLTLTLRRTRITAVSWRLRFPSTPQVNLNQRTMPITRASLMRVSVGPPGSHTS